MPDGINCHVHRCLCGGHWVGGFQTPFCVEHFHDLTPLKQAEVLSIQHLSVLAPGSRTRAMGIINECRRYLLTKQPQRRSA